VLFNSGKIWHEGNDGTGSGLDADTLDGMDSSVFAVKTNPYFPESIRFSSLAAGGSSIAPSGYVSVYFTAGKRFVIAYWDGTDVKYRWTNLSSTDAAWNYQMNGTPPA
jgi:hypothetical protein